MRYLAGFTILSLFISSALPEALLAQDKTLPESGKVSQSFDPTKRTAPGVVVSFEGGNAGQNMAAVLTVAARAGLLASRPYTVGQSDNLCKIIVSLGYPPPCEPFIQVLGLMNPGDKQQALLYKLQPNQTILVPDLGVVKYRSSISYSKTIEREVARSKAVLSNWGDLNAKQTEGLENNLTAGNKGAVDFDAFQLFFKTQSDIQSADFASNIIDLKSTAISFDMLRMQPLPAKAYAATPLQALRDSCKTGAPIAEPYDYVTLAEPDLDAQTSVERGLPDSPVPVTVTLIDVPLTKAPNLYPSFGDTAPAKDWICQWVEFKAGLHHSTHMASIIASNGQYGFQGLSKGAKVDAFPWGTVSSEDKIEPSSADRHIKLGDEIQARSYDPLPLNVFVAAVSFDQWEFALQYGQLPQENMRFVRTLERRIKQYGPFLVAAAGQTADGAPGEALYNTSPLFPMNLGDLPSVLVVTACGPCGVANTRLMPSANFGAGDRKFVHIAAPGGENVPGWVSEKAISATPGTSPAAAYVAGVATAMISNFPQSYKEGSALKARLQVTSRPLTGSFGVPHPDNPKINAGVVDPILALLNPTKHWLKQNGKWRDVKLAPANAFDFRDSTSAEDVRVKLRDVRRIYRMPGAGASRWTLYVDYAAPTDAVANEIKRLGPLQALSGSTAIAQFCGSSGTTALRLEDIDDLVVAKQGFRPADCK